MSATEFSYINFWSKVNFDGPTPIDRPELGPCWVWTAYKKAGYGKFHIEGCPKPTRRIAWLIIKGPLPERPLVPDHLCRNRSCLNPNHLEWVTNRTNVLRGISPAAMNSTKTHCKNGHQFIGYNLGVRPHQDGGLMRVCRTCEKLRQARAYKLQKELA